MKFKVSIIAALVLSLIFSTAALARSSGNYVEILNKTGRDIEELYISPMTRDDWEEYFLSDELESGDSTRIRVDYVRGVKYFDIRCKYTNGKSETWYGVDLYNSDVVILRRGGEYSSR